MDEYTPTTDQVRAGYAIGENKVNPASKADYAAEFDRWLAAHDRAVKAEALREAAEAYMAVGTMYVKGWLLDRADEMEKEATDD